MMLKMKLAALVTAGSLLLAAGLAPAAAASIQTEAFLANIRPNVDFLDRSSRLALDNSGSARIKAFARSEAREQTITANAFVAWSQANTTRGAIGAVAVDGTIVPAGMATVAVPVANDLLTGRSVAIDVPVAVTTSPEEARALLPAGQTDLSRLGALRGRAFDALYRSTQADALRQLAVLYSGYIQNGDDAELRVISIQELPKINHRLMELRRL